jgi:hypothetical protein
VNSDFADAWFKLMHRSTSHPRDGDLEQRAHSCTTFDFLAPEPPVGRWTDWREVAGKIECTTLLAIGAPRKLSVLGARETFTVRNPDRKYFLGPQNFSGPNRARRCTTSAFGGDPAVHTTKACECIGKGVAEAQQCAGEGAICVCSGQARYGTKAGWLDTKARWTDWREVTEKIECTNEAFGTDPAVHEMKVCECEAEGATEAVECAGEDKVCNCAGRVRYGTGAPPPYEPPIDTRWGASRLSPLPTAHCNFESDDPHRAGCKGNPKCSTNHEGYEGARAFVEKFHHGFGALRPPTHAAPCAWHTGHALRMPNSFYIGSLLGEFLCTGSPPGNKLQIEWRPGHAARLLCHASNGELSRGPHSRFPAGRSPCMVNPVRRRQSGPQESDCTAPRLGETSEMIRVQGRSVDDIIQILAERDITAAAPGAPACAG